MKDYDPASSFADPQAVRAHDVRGDEAEAVAFLAALAEGGPVLELAVGGGRVALPLAAQGLRVDGIDVSPQMLAHLRGKPGGDGLRLLQGDLVDVGLDGPYRLVFVVWNSLFNVLEQERQVRCFENVAQRLVAGGRFVVEAFVPSWLHGLARHQHVDAEAVETDSVRLGVLRHDPARQRIDNSHVTLGAAGVYTNVVAQRYVWPAEMDLMARLAGLELEARWGGWLRQEFDRDSKAHVSVYRRPVAA